MEGRRVYCGGSDGYRVLLGTGVGTAEGAVGLADQLGALL